MYGTKCEVSGRDIPLKNYQLYQIQNGRLSARLSATINFNMPDILQTVLDYSLTITMKQNVLFQVGICLEKFQHDQIQNSRPLAIMNQLYSVT